MIRNGEDISMKLDMFRKDETVVLAISGGRDSMCLLDMYYRSGQSIVVCHTNHHQRKASEAEESYIIEYCKKRNIRLEIDEYYPENTDNFQANAHLHRYDFFYRTALKYKSKFVLTAHHKDDQAETILLRLIQGSNLYGYGGISRITKYKDIYLYRPLLDYSREEITNYCIKNNVRFFDDESNETDHYLRNRIRHQILPLMKEENPNILNTLQSFSSICKDSFNHIRNEAIAYLNKNNNLIKISSFEKLDTALQKDIICYLLEELKVSTSFTQINDILNIIFNNRPQLDYNIKGDIVFLKRYDECYFKCLEKSDIDTISLNIGETKIFNGNLCFSLSNTRASDNANSLRICYNYHQLPLIIRTRKNGDFILLSYGKKKLKDLFIDKKINKEARDTIPIISDSDGNILWVYGCAKRKPENEDNIIYLTCEEYNGK